MQEKIKKGLCCLIAALLLFGGIFGAETAYAATAPQIASEGAALYNATTGQFLYEKNANQQFYPASITKFMTALLVLENSSQDDVVVFSDSATGNLESGAVNLELTKGDRVKVRDCLYGLMLKSANEVANGLAEHVSGSVSAFAQKMNRRARQLGCTNTNFVNPNGLNNANHVTTPHDMALIAKACFDRADFRALDQTTSYHFPATQKRPNGTDITMGHRMIAPGGSDYYPGILGGKTGYTSAAGNTLVTCAERNGVRLIAVVMKSKRTQYADTRALLDYGFQVAGESGGKKQEAVGGETAQETSGRVQALTANSQAQSQQENPAENQQAVSPSASQSQAGWLQRNGVWVYREANGELVKNARREINGAQYWFDADGNMKEGWQQDSTGAWYYLTPGQGALQQNCWLQYRNQWYYLGSDGKMLTDSRTPDGYRVNREGVWIG